MLTVVLAIAGGVGAGVFVPALVERAPAAGRRLLALPRGFGPAELLLVATVAAAWGFIAAAFGPSAELPAFLYLGWIGVTLAAIDIRCHRLPDVLVLPSYPVALALLVVAAAARSGPGPLARSLACAVTLAAFYYLIALATPHGLGLGDVKLAGVLGMYLGWVSWSAVVLATVLAFISAAGMALILIGLRRVGGGARIPFGPFMIVGALASVVATR